MVQCSKHCNSETAASICMCDTPLESSLNGPIGGMFILRSTVMVMPLVFSCNVFYPRGKCPSTAGERINAIGINAIVMNLSFRKIKSKEVTSFL